MNSQQRLEFNSSLIQKVASITLKSTWLIELKNTEMNAKEIAVESLSIAADICIYTNHNIISETIEI